MWMSIQDHAVSLYRGRECLGSNLTDIGHILALLGPPSPDTESLAATAWSVLVGTPSRGAVAGLPTQ